MSDDFIELYASEVLDLATTNGWELFEDHTAATGSIYLKFERWEDLDGNRLAPRGAEESAGSLGYAPEDDQADDEVDADQ